MRSATIVCAGGPARRVLPEMPSDTLVIAADGGLDEAERLGLHVDLLVGDLDSASPLAIERVEAGGGTIERHPVDKDASDLELALVAADARDVEAVLVVGGDGGRLDHLLGNAFLLAADRFAAMRIDAVLGHALVHVLRGQRSLTGTRGELISLFAVGGSWVGVTAQGFRWQLDDDELLPGSTRGLSNAFDGEHASIAVRDGVVVAIRPGPELP